MQKVIYWSDDDTIDRDYVLRLKEKFGQMEDEELLRVFLCDVMPGKITLVSSFGAEAAVLLHMVAKIDRGTPVLFIDTKHLFSETLRYRDALAERLGLQNLVVIKPDEVVLMQEDRDNRLWEVSPDQCCHVRKVLPLERALAPYSGWITGRKRSHGGVRQNLQLIELSSGKIKLNPLVNWTADRIDAYFKNHDIPRHPLFEKGYVSIGCTHCTIRPVDPSDPRSGRWAGSGKTECGIHSNTR